MNNKRQEISEKFNRILSKMINCNTLVIVEGKKDAKALSNLGLKNIVCLSKKPIYKIAEEIAIKNKEVTILTDLDSEGKVLYHRLNVTLTSLGVRVNNELRNFLLKNTNLRQIEGLESYAKKFNLIK